MKRLSILIIGLCLFTTNAFSQYMRMSNPDRGWENTGVVLTEDVYSVVDKGSYSVVNSYLSFKSDDPSEFNEDTQIELFAYFQLPEGYEITNLWLWVGDDIMEARMYDRWTAERIYEGIVNRRRDPAIIYKNWWGWYELRIYPFKKDEIRKIRITYLVPNNLNSTGSNITLPNQIQNLSSYNEADAGFLVFTDLNADDVSISGEVNPNFETGFLNGERFLQTTIPGDGQTHQFTISKLQEIDSVKVRTFYSGDEKYFDISVLPFDLIETNESQKVVVLVDHEEENTNLTNSDVVDAIKQQLKNYLSDNDYFNVMFSGLSTIYLSESWLKATESKIDSAFADFDQMDDLGFSNLDNLITDSFDFSEQHLDEVSVVLVSSTQNYSNISNANEFLDAIDEYTQGNYPKTFISDIQTRNFNYEWRNGRYYVGNEYLYLNLSRDTGS